VSLSPAVFGFTSNILRCIHLCYHAFRFRSLRLTSSSRLLPLISFSYLRAASYNSHFLMLACPSASAFTRTHSRVLTALRHARRIYVKIRWENGSQGLNGLVSSRVSLVIRVIVHKAGNRPVRNTRQLHTVPSAWKERRELVRRLSPLRLRNRRKMNGARNLDPSTLHSGVRRPRRRFGHIHRPKRRGRKTVN
jgi:hypothetical protein